MGPNLEVLLDSTGTEHTLYFNGIMLFDYDRLLCPECLNDSVQWRLNCDSGIFDARDDYKNKVYLALKYYDNWI